TRARGPAIFVAVEGRVLDACERTHELVVTIESTADRVGCERVAHGPRRRTACRLTPPTERWARAVQSSRSVRWAPAARFSRTDTVGDSRRLAPRVAFGFRRPAPATWR